MNGAVVYYTKTGSTGVIARRFAEKMNFQIYKLEDAKEKESVNVFASWLGLRVALKKPLPELKDYDFIVLMSPIWAWHPAPELNTLIDKADLAGKRIFLVGVGAMDTNEKAMLRFSRRVLKHKGKVVGTKTFKGLQLKQDLGEVESELQKSADELVELVGRLQSQ